MLGAGNACRAGASLRVSLSPERLFHTVLTASQITLQKRHTQTWRAGAYLYQDCRIPNVSCPSLWSRSYLTYWKRQVGWVGSLYGQGPPCRISLHILHIQSVRRPSLDPRHPCTKLDLVVTTHNHCLRDVSGSSAPRVGHKMSRHQLLCYLPAATPPSPLRAP